MSGSSLNLLAQTDDKFQVVASLEPLISWAETNQKIFAQEYEKSGLANTFKALASYSEKFNSLLIDTGFKKFLDHYKTEIQKFQEVLLSIKAQTISAWENLKALFKKSIYRAKSFSTAWLIKKFELVEVLSPPDFLHRFIYLPSPKDFHFTYSFKSQAPPILA
jgi:hypothetical protein